MKKKVFKKKLTLNKETISNLNKNGMFNIKGGVNPTYTEPTDNDFERDTVWDAGTRNSCPGHTTC